MHSFRCFPSRALAAVSLVSIASSSFAVVGTTSHSTADLAADTHFSFVGQLNGASGVAVGPYAFLTAGHVLGGGAKSGTFVLDGNSYSIDHSVAAPNYKDLDPLSPTFNQYTHVDLTLVFVKQRLPGWYNISTNLATTPITMVGYGGSGVVESDNLGYNINVGQGTRRAADNTVDAQGTIFVDPSLTGGAGAAGGPVLESYLKGAGEAALVGGDSGGGWFQGDSLVGINSFIFNDTQSGTETSPKYANYGFPGKNTDGYTSQDTHHAGHPDYIIPPLAPYFGSGAINLTDPQLRPFLAQAVPEPGSFAVVGLGLAALLRRRRR